ncbi:YbjN domain-containing protein [Corynebacterium sp. A21]|uniref:YbjN domain-containing protein n=1 Tax=Corynebacterium sp. A21 TaxID=3457318 RepID=UPI003FD0118F
MSEHAAGPGHTKGPRPEPVTLAAVKAAGESFGYSSYPASDRLIFPWNDHRVTVFLLGGHGLSTDSPETLVFDGQLREELDLSEVNMLAHTINTWNRERLGPTVSFRLDGQGRLKLHSRAALQIRCGFNGEQLAEGLHETMETIQLAVAQLLQDFPHLRYEDDTTAEIRHEADVSALQEALPGALQDGSLPTSTSEAEIPLLMTRRSPGPDSGEPDPERERSDPEGGNHPHPEPGEPGDAAAANSREKSAVPFNELPGFPVFHDDTRDEEDEPASGEADHDLPYPVSLDRVRDALADLGVRKTRGDDEVIIAWVNEVLFGFFLDNGPSYLVKGHWDPGLDPESDFLRIFLLCNDWNESAINTKAFCHSDDDGLQVRVEFTAPVGEGLNDAQLGHNTEVAINQVLHALDVISTDATGESVVRWPHSGRD